MEPDFRLLKSVFAWLLMRTLKTMMLVNLPPTSRSTTGEGRLEMHIAG